MAVVPATTTERIIVVGIFPFPQQANVSATVNRDHFHGGQHNTPAAVNAHVPQQALYVARCG
jgi:hypothetical protein